MWSMLELIPTVFTLSYMRIQKKDQYERCALWTFPCTLNDLW